MVHKRRKKKKNPYQRNPLKRKVPNQKLNEELFELDKMSSYLLGQANM